MFSPTHLFCFLVTLFLVNCTTRMTSFDKAYFYGQAALDSCNNMLVQLHCYKTCGPDYTCRRGKCSCEETLYTTSNNQDELATIFAELQRYVYEYYLNQTNNLGPKHILEDDGNSFIDATLRSSPVKQVPILRHHIAHFCPNLDEARKCIRRCMALGKPAFCGKDHICHCGHTYKHNNKDKLQDPNDIYAEFRDLYEKYFGPNTESVEDKKKSY